MFWWLYFVGKDQQKMEMLFMNWILKENYMPVLLLREMCKSISSEDDDSMPMTGDTSFSYDIVMSLYFSFIIFCYYY